MSNATYDRLWQEGMAELNEQLYVEDHTMGLDDIDESQNAPPQIPTPTEAFQHWGCLYIKYIQIFRDLEECYDKMLQPQKRINVKLVMEVVMTRILDLKQKLVKWNPVHPDLIGQSAALQNPFPWEYIQLDDILVDLKLPPETLTMPIPRFFIEESIAEQRARDKLVVALMQHRLGLDTVPVQEDSDINKPLLQFTMEEAVAVLQRNERGRQGMNRAVLIKQLREEEMQRKLHHIKSASREVDPEVAASNIQRLFRGHASRRAAIQDRDEELAFIGMRQSTNSTEKLQLVKREEEFKKERERLRELRKIGQVERADLYNNSLISLHQTVLDEEGPDMREKMMEERRRWFTEELGKGNFPEDLGGYYLSTMPQGEEKVGGDGSAEGKKEDKGKKGKKEEKGGKKGEKKDDDDVVEKPPPLTGSTPETKKMNECVNMYEEVWLDRDESNNFQQQHDVELAKALVRPNVEEEVRENVDKVLVLQLQNLKAQLEAAASGKKGKGKGGKGKKGKGKGKGKGKKGKGKGAKKGKGKALPGEKLCGSMDIEQMLSILVEHGLVNHSPPSKLDSLVGAFNYLGTIYRHANTKDRLGNWVPQDPSIPQIQNAIVEHIVMPLGSTHVREMGHFSKSVLLYGPKNSGKTTVAQAVAHHTNALFINLSASNLDGKFNESKNGPTKLIHMAFAVARHPSFAPAVIYIDNIERIFVGKKKPSNDGISYDAARFRKDLTTYINSLTSVDRVCVIGCTTQPASIPESEIKDLRNVFQKHFYMPFPSYASRVLIWRSTIEHALNEYGFVLPEELDVSSLAHITDGFTAGSIVSAILRTLSERRVQALVRRPLAEDEFLSALAQIPRNYQEDNEKFQHFTASLTGLTARRNQVKAEASGESEVKKGGKDGGKKGGKKKKGKKK